MKYLSILLLFLFTVNSTSLFSQEDTISSSDTTKRDFYLIKKTDGGEFYGYILSDDGREILLNTKTIGKIYINKSDIKEIIKLDETEVASHSDIYGDFRETGPFTTRYYFTTNALPIKKKENYAMLHLYGPEVHFSLTDKFSLGVMATWAASPVVLAAKYSLYSKDKTHIAIGTMLGSSGYINKAKGYGGLHWLTITQGNRKTNMSFSAGYGYMNIGQNIDLGSQYEFQNHSPSELYYIANDDLFIALEETVYGGNSNFEITRSGLTGAAVLGIAGITPVGKRASFIFDSMTFFSMPKRVKYVDQSVEVTYQDIQNGTTVTETTLIGLGEIIEGNSISTDMRTTILLMPGMRFNTAFDKAFQITLAGIIDIQADGEVTTFPIPMVSWLRQF